MIYALYINGVLYKAYKQRGHLTNVVRANRREGRTLTYKQIDDETYQESNAEDLLPEPCPECGEIPTRSSLYSSSTYWHRYDCSFRRNNGIPF